MKPTDKQIMEWADAYGYNHTESILLQKGAKWALSQDSTLEKVKELRDKYQNKIESHVIVYETEKIIEELNSIIENK